MNTRNRSRPIEPERRTFVLRLSLAGFLCSLSLLVSCHRCTSTAPPSAGRFELARQQLVGDLRASGIDDERVLAAVGRVRREEFVRAQDLHRAYLDRALPIEEGQTISQPFVVARMTELLEVDREARVLEVGTGSGYQAAVLAELVDQVFSIEIDAELADSARRRLERLGYANVHVRTGDGFFGWPEAAPFDAAIITAAAPKVPAAIVAQLIQGGRLVMPLDKGTSQVLVRGYKKGSEVILEELLGVIFVPMTGEVRRE